MRLKKVKNEKKPVANLQLVKETNLALVFNLINKYEPISRAEIAQITKLSPTTISSQTEELISTGMVFEKGIGNTTTSGRKPIMLEVNPEGGFVVSIEMIGSGFNCGFYDLKCRMILKKVYDVPDYDTIGDKIIDAIDSTIKKENMDISKLFGICIGIPGLIDTEKNRVITSTVIPIDEQNDFYFRIQERFKNTMVIIGNESSLSAYAEKEFGTKENIRNLVFVDINIGIGAGIIIDDKILTGAFGIAGELGHMSIDMNGPRCKCGNRGCLEIMASIPAILQKIIFAIMSGRDTVIKNYIGNEYNRIDIGIIKDAADKNDELAVEVLDETAVKLAFGVNNIINIFNPEVVVIGGEITKLGDLFLEKLKTAVSTIALKPIISKIEIRYSGVEDNLVILGGARYALDMFLKRKVLNITDMHY